MTDDDLFTVTTLAYHEWTKAYDNLKVVKNETPTNEMDYLLFHNHRLKEAIAEEAKWDQLVQRLRSSWPVHMRRRFSNLSIGD